MILGWTLTLAKEDLRTWLPTFQSCNLLVALDAPISILMAWSISYPPTAAHLCLLLSTLRVSGPDAHDNEHRINDPKVFQPSCSKPHHGYRTFEVSFVWKWSTPDFVRSSCQGGIILHNSPIYSSYLTLLNRVLGFYSEISTPQCQWLKN